MLGGCLPAARAGSLPATLSMVEVPGGSVAVQNGIAVPTFDAQPRDRIDLSGAWRVEPQVLDSDLSLTDRGSALDGIEAEAAGRQLQDFDDGAWDVTSVPGTLNPPPKGVEIGGWYRRAFTVPDSWIARSATLKFASANYLADVWINGTWIGYHEGGSTPFAFDVASVLQPDVVNVIAVRVDNPAWGTRTDIVPWGLGDWWNYGGLTGAVWIEAAPTVQLVRADVVPHLDAAEVRVVVRNAADAIAAQDGSEPEAAPNQVTVRAALLPAAVTDQNLLDPDPGALVPAQSIELAQSEVAIAVPPAGEQVLANLSFRFAEADLWSPETPALYVMRVTLLPVADDADLPMDAREARPRDIPRDELVTTFGLRHVAVDARAPRILLNGDPVFLQGVGVHDEALTFGTDGRLTGGSPAPSPTELRRQLDAAEGIGANLLRTGHMPADPLLLQLADRLGFTVWEELPLYHFTPLTFGTAMSRGIPQQMLREMALRDMNRPSVLFHGLANESTGDAERTDALRELHEVDRAIDGTRLTGQAAYGWRPTDPTHEPLDVAGYTLYYGVFYGTDAAADTERALRAAHETYPDKPIVALEFGRWADSIIDEALQAEIFEDTHGVLERHRADRAAGDVAAATWWALSDFATQVPGVELEDFGLYRSDGTLRPAGDAAALRSAATDDATAGPDVASDLRPAPVIGDLAFNDWRLAGFLAYAFAVSTGMIGIVTVFLVRRGGRATGRRRRRHHAR
jgi:beta-galactosidase